MGVKVQFNPSTGKASHNSVSGRAQILSEPCVCPGVGSPVGIPSSLRVRFSGLGWCTNCVSAVSSNQSFFRNNFSVSYTDIDVPYIGNCNYQAISAIQGSFDENTCIGSPFDCSCGSPTINNRNINLTISITYAANILTISTSLFNNQGLVLQGSEPFPSTGCEFGDTLPLTINNTLTPCGTIQSSSIILATGGSVTISETP